MSPGMKFWDVILGWYYNILEWKSIWEKKTVCLFFQLRKIYYHNKFSSQNKVPKYHHGIIHIADIYRAKKILGFPNGILNFGSLWKAWKREAMDLLVDSTFFQMDLASLRHWKTTVDNLMTHDKTTFKELMSKCSNYSTFKDSNAV